MILAMIREENRGEKRREEKRRGEQRRDKKIIRRQDAPRVFEHVASIYILSPDYVRKGTGLLSGETIGYDIGQDKSVDIDSEFDFALMEFLFEKKGRNV